VGTALYFSGAVAGVTALFHHGIPSFLRKVAIKTYLISNFVVTFLVYLTTGAATTAIILGAIIAWFSTNFLVSLEDSRTGIAG
tara:strand:+ start:31 stop:279 length:249 start_codon:yes stop_codon:yes gene_type:complete